MHSIVAAQWNAISGPSLQVIFGGQNICGSVILVSFVVYIFVVAACTAGKGR